MDLVHTVCTLSVFAFTFLCGAAKNRITAQMEYEMRPSATNREQRTDYKQHQQKKNERNERKKEKKRCENYEKFISAIKIRRCFAKRVDPLVLDADAVASCVCAIFLVFRSGFYKGIRSLCFSTQYTLISIDTIYSLMHARNFFYTYL